MELMIIKDAMLSKSGNTIITGPLLLMNFMRRSEVETAFGASVLVSSVDGNTVHAPVKGITVSQTFSGNWQVSLMIDYPSELNSIALGSIVTKI